MKQYILPLLLGIVAVVFGTLYITKDAKPDPVAPTTSTPEVDTSQMESISSENAELKARLAELELQAKRDAEARRAEAEIAAIATPAPAATATGLQADAEPNVLTEQERQAQALGKLAQAFMQNMGAMATNENSSAQREEMRSNWRETMSLEGQRRAAEQYGDLLSQFDLSLEERQEFLAILAKKQGGRGWGRWGRGGGGGGGEDQESVEAEIKTFLGDEGYAEYRQFEDTKYGRGKVGDFDKVLGSGMALNEAQNDKMVELFGGMEDFEKDFRRDAGMGRMGRDADQTAVDMDKRLTELESEYNQIIIDSADVLDERQLEALSSHLDNNLKRAETSIGMANQWQRSMEQALPAEGRQELQKLFENMRGGGR